MELTKKETQFLYMDAADAFTCAPQRVINREKSARQKLTNIKKQVIQMQALLLNNHGYRKEDLELITLANSVLKECLDGKA